MENTDNLISIVVPIYNVEQYLPKCVDTLVNQTYKNIEIILVNDGSKDNSGKLCDELAETDPRISVIHKKNGGLSSARNAGMKVAKGKYIGFVDSDDWLDLKMYETLLDLLISNDADIAYADYFKASDDNAKIDFTGSPEVKCFNKDEGLDNFYNDISAQTIVAWNKLYKRELFDDIEYPNGKIHEDEGTTYKVFFKAKKTVYTNLPLYYYRYNPESITNSKFSKKNLDILDVYEEKLQFVKDNNLNRIYSKTLKWYLFKLTYCYFGCCNNLNECKEYIPSIKSKINSVFKEYKNSNEKQLHWIILFSIFQVSPKLYNSLLNKLKS